MFEFTIDTDSFNRVLERITSSCGKDPESTLIIESVGGELHFYYKCRIDGGDSFGYFKERITPISTDGEGSISVLTIELTGLRIPEFRNINKFPHCKVLNFSATDSKLSMWYEVAWDQGSSSVVRLSHPVLESKQDLKGFNRLAKVSPEVIIPVEVFSDAIVNCGSFSTDATSKESNGCLLQVLSPKFLMVGTDSNIAAKYEYEFPENIKEDQTFKIVLSNGVLKIIRGFIIGLESVAVTTNHNYLVVAAGARKMMVPVMKIDYRIDNPEEFFSQEAERVSNLYLGALTSTITTLLNRSKDHHRQVSMRFSNKSGLLVKTDNNESDKVPADIFNEVNILVNGELLSEATKRLATLDQTAELQYHKQFHRLGLSSPGGKLVFLVQGLADDHSE